MTITIRSEAHEPTDEASHVPGMAFRRAGRWMCPICDPLTDRERAALEAKQSPE